MTNILRLCAAASIGAWLIASAAADDRKTPDDARPDPRLDQRISVSVAYDSLQEFCAKLTHISEGRVQEPAARAPLGATSSEVAGNPRGLETSRPIVSAASSFGVAQDKPEVADPTTPAAPLVGQPSAKPTADKYRLSEPGEEDGRPPVRPFEYPQGRQGPVDSAQGKQGKQGAAATPDANPSPAEGGRAPSSGSPRDLGIARPISVDITCDPAIKEHKVVVRVKEQPLREVMRQVAVLFDFTWMQGPQEHPRYHLMQNSARSKRAEEMRQRYLKERSARYRQLFKNTVRAVKAGPDELRELAQSDPEAVALALTTERIGVLRALDEAAVDAVLAGQVVRIPLNALPADVQNEVKERFLRRWLMPGGYQPAGERPHTEADWRWDQAQLTYQRDEGWFQWHVSVMMDLPAANADTRPTSNYMVAFFAPQGMWTRLGGALASFEDRERGDSSERYQRLRSLETDYGINIIDRAQKQGADVVPPWARPDAASEPPKPSGEGVALKGAYASTYSWFPLLLRDVAEQLDINLVADYYWTQCDRSRDWPSRGSESRYAPVYPSIKDETGTYYVDGNPEYALYRICEQRGRGWIKDGDFFRVRNLLWFVDDPEEVPASVLREWMRRTDHEKHAAPEDYVYLVTNLSQHLAGNITATEYYDGSDELYIFNRATAVSYSAGGYYAMKLYGLLGADLRKRAEEVGIGVNTELPQDLLWMVEQILTEDRSHNNQPLIDRLTDEQLSNLRLWTGRRQVEMSPDDTGGRQGVREHSFCIELWSGATPTWADKWAKGSVWAGSYWIHTAQDPDKVGKLAEPYASMERERQRKAK